MAIGENHTFAVDRMNHRGPLENNRTMAKAPPEAINDEIARRGRTRCDGVPGERRSCGPWGASSGGPCFQVAARYRRPFRRMLLNNAEKNFFRPVQHPVRGIVRNFNVADQSGLAINLQRKHRTVNTGAFDAAHVMVRSSKPGTSDRANVGRFCSYFTRWPDHPITRFQMAVSGAGTYGNPPKFARFENFAAHVA